MLIVNAEIYGAAQTADIRLRGDRITRIGSLPPLPGETILDATGCALLPGLHDHHIHLLAYAASLNSVACGPQENADERSFVAALRTHPGSGWLRGYGYHQSVAGDIDRAWLDQHLPDRPARIQHRSGRLWILNSAGLETLAERLDQTADLELPEDGRLFDQDQALGIVLGRELPPVGDASRRLAGFGVTGLTDMTPANDLDQLALFRELRRSGVLSQSIHVAGTPSLPYPQAGEGVFTSATKLHLHESALPTFERLRNLIETSHEQHRPVAVHCVTEVELVFTLSALKEAGVLEGDRIEHASVTPPALLEALAELGLTVVTQPNFISERGDAYLNDVSAKDVPWLYRARSFPEAGVALAGGTDAPFGQADPWHAARSAVERKTASGARLGEAETLSPEQAIELFLGEPDQPAEPRRITEGARADLCLLNQPWRVARKALSSSLVRATLCGGRLTYDGTFTGSGTFTGLGPASDTG